MRKVKVILFVFIILLFISVVTLSILQLCDVITDSGIALMLSALSVLLVIALQRVDNKLKSSNETSEKKMQSPDGNQDENKKEK